MPCPCGWRDEPERVCTCTPALIARDRRRVPHALLERQGFLDMSSGLTPRSGLPLRRDPQRRYERRVRVFENQIYRADYCIVRAQSVPEADRFVRVYFGLIADERRILAVVQRGSIFNTNGDGSERETVPAVWRPRTGGGDGCRINLQRSSPSHARWPNPDRRCPQSRLY